MQKMIIISILFVFSGSLWCSENPRSGTTPRQPSRLAYWLSGQDPEMVEEFERAQQAIQESLQVLKDANENLKKTTERVDKMNERATERNNEIQQILNENDK